MTFEEILIQTIEMLKRQKSVSYRALQRQFEIDETYLSDLKFELTQVKKVAKDVDGIMLTLLEQEADEVQKRPTAERRQLTVMFIDLVGSTALSSSMDPEDFCDILYAYQDICDDLVKKNQGTVVQLLGDGIMAYFGYPIAHEDDPKRAVMAGLQMFDALEVLNERLEKEKNISLQIRIGVHTGLVVIGTAGGKGHTEILALGEAPNLAARIQGAAIPNTMLISEVTRKLVRDSFNVISNGKNNLKGFNDSIELFQVMGVKVRTNSEFSNNDYLTPFVGRVQEQNLMKEKWELTRSSNGQVILVSGEAGIGKSRLTHSVVSEIANGSTSVLTFRCSTYHRNTSFQPIIETLKNEIGLKSSDTPIKQLNLVKQYLKNHQLDEAQDLALCASFLSIPTNGNVEGLISTPDILKALTFSFLTRWLLGDSRPSIILLEDMHWADPSTLELLDEIILTIHHSSVFFIGTFRPEFIPHWNEAPHINHIIVNRMTRAEAESMIQKLTLKLPGRLTKDLLAKTDGNPLFVEEVTKLVLESDILSEKKGKYKLKGSLKSLAIPNTLQDSLMARLDRLGEAKEIAQIGATIGREFPYSILQPICQCSTDELNQFLAQLVDAQILFMRGESLHATYTFKHALTRETAYSSLLKKRRQEIHQDIVGCLEKQLTKSGELNTELLAHHCTEARMYEKAIPYWKEAGEKAVRQSAHTEAINNLNEGLALIASLPTNKTTQHQEISFLIALGIPLTALRGYGSPEVEESYTKAYELCKQLGETAQLVPALYGLWRYFLLKAEYQEAEEVSAKLLELSNESGALIHRHIAHRAAGSTFIYLGQWEKARMHLEAIIKVKPTEEVHQIALQFDVVNLWVVAHAYLAWALWMQGELEAAEEQGLAAIRLAEKISHPFSIALSRCFAAWLFQFKGDIDKSLECAQEGLLVAEENGFTFWIGWAKILIGWCRDKKGMKGQVNVMSEGLKTWIDTGSELGSSYFLFLQSERYLANKELTKAQQVLDKSKLFMEKTKESWWQSEIDRLQGNIHLADKTPDLQKAERYFRRAIHTAKDQKAISLELRATSDLTRLLNNSSVKSMLGNQ